MASQDWRELGEGNLYLKSTFGSDSYTIWATDLSQLSIEQLDADDLLWRARHDKIPIDLDEAHNISILLKHLSTAVQNGELTISSSRANRHLELSTTVRLPYPLPEFQWIFKLELQSDEKFRVDVTKPMLTKIQGLGQHEEDLIHRLHEKDHVIDRLLGALAKHNVSLPEVFPALASLRRSSVTRDDAESHIPALKSFDTDEWQNSISRGERYERKEPVVSDDKEEAEFEQKSDVNSKTVSSTKADFDSLQSSKKSQKSNGPPKKGIQRTLGRKAPSMLARQTPEPVAGTDATTDDETPAKNRTPSSAQEKPKRGIKRTLGHRHSSPLATSPVAKHDTTPSSRHVPEEEEPKVDSEEEAERLAEEKRKSLKEELDRAAALRPKKRRF